MDLRFLLLVVAVIVAAGLTVAALALGAPEYFPVAGLAALVAALAVRFRR